MPWSNNKIIARQYIQQFYVKERLRNSKGLVVRSYDVQVIIQGNINISLIIESVVEACFIEKKLEEFLHMADHPVKGSYRHK